MAKIKSVAKKKSSKTSASKKASASKGKSQAKAKKKSAASKTQSKASSKSPAKASGKMKKAQPPVSAEENAKIEKMEVIAAYLDEVFHLAGHSVDEGREATDPWQEILLAMIYLHNQQDHPSPQGFHTGQAGQATSGLNSEHGQGSSTAQGQQQAGDVTSHQIQGLKIICSCDEKEHAIDLKDYAHTCGADHGESATDLH